MKQARRSKSWILPFLALAWAFSAVQVFAQKIESTEEPVIKVNTTLLNIPVIVSDKDGKPVTGLRRENFKVSAGGREQRIEYFSDTQMPVSVVIALDMSGSVSRMIGGIKSGAREFIDKLEPSDRCMVVTFGDKIKVVQEFTSDKNLLKKRISMVSGISRGLDLMNEMLLSVIKREFANIEGRKAIVLLTDAGEINESTTALLMDELIESDTVIYSIYYPTQSMGFPLRERFNRAELITHTPVRNLSEIAAATGGLLLFAWGDRFRPNFQAILEELKRLYVLGFYADAEGDEESRIIDIRVDRPHASVRTKRAVRLKAIPHPIQ